MMKVLIVDDDDDIRMIASIALADENEVLEANCGSEALRVAEKEQPDLILLDMMMPDMDGKTTFSKLRQLPNLADTPVIYVTAKVQESEIQTYINSGVAGVITKPFDPITLPQEILDILAATSKA
jgi:two-component system, OmpR family, response regulator